LAYLHSRQPLDLMQSASVLMLITSRLTSAASFANPEVGVVVLGEAGGMNELLDHFVERSIAVVLSRITL
jgi:hypothetical protein